MIAVVTLLFVIALSLFVVRIGTIALTMTGLSPDIARFQALSAFSRTGFGASEAEQVLATPARRRIAGTLIRLGSVGIVTAISTLVLSFAAADENTVRRVILLSSGLVAIVLLGRWKRLDDMATPAIRRLLKSTALLDLRDYAELLHLRDGWQVVALEVVANGGLVGLRLAEVTVPGITVLGIESEDGAYEGTPGSDARLTKGDRVLLYGRSDRIGALAGFNA